MVNLNIAELRLQIDLEGKYVDFGFLRTALMVAEIVGDINISLSGANKEGECRGQCPKCQKEKSFSLNINTNRFNCFAKGCTLKGGGVIDFFAKLYEVSAKEASHLLACAYGVQPYTQEPVTIDIQANGKPAAEPTPIKREVKQPSTEVSQLAPPITAQHLIASIEHQLAELKKILANR